VRAAAADAQDPIVADELALLAGVTAVLEVPPEPRADSELSIVRELERLRGLLLSRGESKDAVALREQWHRNSSLLAQLRRSRQASSVDPRSPYFAHLRLREAETERDLCLGHATRVEGGVRIVDWRNAPVSKIFYRYQQGDEYEEEFAGRVRTGEVVARRVLLIRDAALERIEAPEGIFTAELEAPGQWRRFEPTRPRLAGGEASALRAHGAGGEGEWLSGGDVARRLGGDLLGARRRADKHLPEITSLIDPDQFDLITQPSSGFLVIRGAAGSGKTTVALHRIAYLAFEEPSITSGRTLFVVFSPALRNYVGHVLPALGVEGVRILTYRDWAAEQRRRHFPALPGELRDDTPAEVQRLKLHPALGVALEQQVREVGGATSREQAVDDWASVLTRQPLLQEVCAREAPGAFTAAQIRRFVEWNRRNHEDLFAWQAGDRTIQAELDPEDDTLLLRAWQLRVGPLRRRGRRPLRYRHIAVDEAQDFSPLEVQVLLGCLDRERSVTLAGDTHQHLAPHSGFTSWSEFLGHLGVPGTEVETLRISYRSSQEIAEFALSLLGDLREDAELPVSTRSGPPVELFRFGDRGSCVAFLADALKDLVREEPLASVAVLTPSPELSAVYCRGLGNSDLLSLRQVENQDFTFAPGVEVTEIEQVKGLEFDYVVLVEVSDERFPDTPRARRLLHVGATRAVHQLWVTSVGTPSALVRVAPRDHG
jgi:DNA helicase-2/ATP-dependent DNA helicase PcrA